MHKVTTPERAIFKLQQYIMMQKHNLGILQKVKRKSYMEVVQCQ